MFTIVFLLGALTLFYVWLKWNYTFWKRNKVPGPEPTLFVGNIGSTFTFSEHWGVITADWYKKYSEPYIGYYKMLKPTILARDPDLIKDIMITNFNSFRDNDFALSKKHDPLFASNPFFTRDEEWREGRKMILSAFSQSKIKSIMPVMNGVGDDFVKYIKSFPTNTDFNAKDISVRFTTENVIKCTFSIDPGCFNKEQESEFLEAGKRLFAPSFMAALKFLSIPLLPQWALDLIPVPFLPASIDHLFRTLVGTNKASRSKDFQSHDILQILLQLQAKHNFDDTSLAGHTLSLFIDGTETSSTALSYALYELALNPACQQKALDEITQVISKHDGKLTAEGLQEMIYVEGILHEGMRMHPPLIVLAKTCTKPYTLPKTSGQLEPITISPGMGVSINVWGIHMDPKYYSDPESFNPSRFNEEEQRNRHKGTYLGFGEGPRICLGQRFAIAQIKVALAYTIQNFHIKLSPNHKPIVIDPQTFLSYPRDGILVRLEAR
ncbi:probable cytochrome P450 6a13 [Sitodiplosis mosellana]|uniref:probable cytochrome P450 6a13 n=1 Tax=Sitodiplosis mosellana TaxID=263140 RepID=UPI0024438BB6|nr:probable cytochrome P450 6a13 [Sitodiplosis mosellana]